MERRRLGNFLKRVTLITGLLLTVINFVQAKEYGLEKAQVYYQIKNDGSIAVTWDLTYWFSGSFSTAWVTIPQHQFKLINPAVSEVREGAEIPYRFQQETPDLTPDTFDFTQDGREYRIAWFYRAANTNKTFRLRYEIWEGLKVYDDVAEFYFKVWGGDWAVSLPALWVEVTLPAPIEVKEDVAYWLHPKVEGRIGISKDFRKIIAYAGDIPARQWVEVRVVFPRAYLSNPDPAKVISIAGLGKEKVLREEQSWEEREARKQRLLKILAAASWPVAATLFLIGLIIPIRTYLRYGREPKIQYERDYEQEVPEEVSPAQADMIISQGKTVSPKGVVASTLELARQGFIKIEEVEREGFLGKKIKDYKIILTGKSKEESLPSELGLFLTQWEKLAGKTGVLISELKKKNLADFKLKFDKSVRSAVYGKKGWINSQGEKVLTLWTIAWIILTILSLIVLLGTGLLPTITTPVLLPGVLFFNTLLSLIFRKPVRQYTAEGKLLTLRLGALRKFLKDFSLLSEHAPASLIIWEKYLVFGTVLGVAKEVLRAMKELKIPLESISWFSLGVTGRISDFNAAFDSFNASLSSFSQAFSSAVASSTSSGSSAGGGRGAGGGGGGAR